MRKKLGIIFTIILAIFLVGFFAYANDYYRAKPEALEISKLATIENQNLFFKGNKKTGFIIYPGGKVDEKAYSLIAKKLNDEDYSVAIVKVPLHLSIIDSNKAKQIINTHSEIDEWIIIGHSLGGTSASIYAEKNPEKLKGIVFLGSYPYKDLSKTSLKILNIVGTNDTVLNLEKYNESKILYPTENKIVTIEGGNHGQFGDYGFQKGDGEATISFEEQIDISVKNILEYFFN